MSEGFTQVEARMPEHKEKEILGPKLLIVYGPPSVGKLTVSEEIAKKAPGFEIFHNHEVYDSVAKEMKEGTPEFWERVFKERLRILEEKLQNGENIIYTYAYNPKPINDNFIAAVKELVERHGGKLMFTKLDCDEEELLKRVASESRKKYGKIVDQDKLKANLASHDYSTQIDGEHSIRIDSTDLDASETASAIIEKLQLI
jgi:predicted kinase